MERPSGRSFSDQSIVSRAKRGEHYNWESVLGHPSFDEFAKESYDDANGYAIRINPTTGDKEMFIAGTKNAKQWALNAWDMPWYNLANVTHIKAFERMDPWRYKKTKYFEKIAREENVDVIYGHSRGGAILADMDVGDHVTKVGLDAAMIIAAEKNTTNLHEYEGVTGIFDEFLSITGKENVDFDLGPRFHSVWS